MAFGLPGGFRQRHDIHILAAAGVNHATVWLTRTEEPDAVAELDELARELL